MSETQQNLAKQLIDDLSNCLEENRLEAALNIFKNSSNDNVIKEMSWDIVPIVSSHLTIENAESNEDKINCCRTILDMVIEKCNPSETVLELLEQIEDSENDVLFCVILSVLGKCLSKMDDKTKAIEWCVSTIRSYVDNIQIPQKEFENYKTNMNKIRNVYNANLSFLELLVKETMISRSEKNEILRDYLASVLIFLMGKPLCYLQEKELQSGLEPSLPEKIVILTSNVTGDLLWFLNIVNTRSTRSKSKKKNMHEESTNLKVTLFELNENIPDLAYANFYFYVVTKSHLWENVPQVYDSQYIFETCIYLTIKLLQEQECVGKGLNFLKHLLGKIEKQTLTLGLLQLSVYFCLFEVLIKLMIYCSHDKERKMALSLFQEYIKMFDMEARYFIILRLYQISNHSGLLSLITAIFKASVIECLHAIPPIPYFLGNNLETLIKLACKLPHGSTSDLVELSDEVITSLNLLRFLFLRDKDNLTGIWHLVDKLQNDYLKPLREGIDLCRAHWKVKVKDLEIQRKTYKICDNMELEKRDTEVTLIVGGEKLPAMPVLEKISFCYQVLNGLDVMECILIRVNECIAGNPLKLKKL